MIADLHYLLNLGAFSVFYFQIQGKLLAVVDIQHFGVNLGREEDMLSGFKAKEMLFALTSPSHTYGHS